jgi:hypothetical protein
MCVRAQCEIRLHYIPSMCVQKGNGTNNTERSSYMATLALHTVHVRPKRQRHKQNTNTHYAYTLLRTVHMRPNTSYNKTKPVQLRYIPSVRVQKIVGAAERLVT